MYLISYLYFYIIVITNSQLLLQIITTIISLGLFLMQSLYGEEENNADLDITSKD